MKNLKNNSDALQTDQRATEKDQAPASKNIHKKKKEEIRKKLILELSKKILKITDKQEQWAINNCVEYYGYYYTKTCTCLNCSKKFELNIHCKTVNCPNCGIKLILKKTRNRKYSDYKYFAIAQSISDFQLIRNFKIYYKFKINEEPKIIITEILQHWIDETGDREVYALKHNLFFNIDNWGGDMEFRNKKNIRIYDLYPYAYYPYSNFKLKYRKIGIDKNLQGFTFLEAINVLTKNSKAETLLKAKYYDFFYRFNDWEQNINEFWKSIKIVLRNKYIIKNLDEYFDYLGFLKDFNKDLTNPKYVCPKDLSKEHNKYVIKSNERRKKIEKERLFEQIKEEEEQYQQKINKLKNFFIEKDEFLIKVLDSVEEVANEGEKLKHCVFERGYHRKKNSLLLSARLKENIDEPLETIEISLERMEILQSRGIFNQPSQFNNQITNLVNKTVLPQIKKYL